MECATWLSAPVLRSPPAGPSGLGRPQPPHERVHRAQADGRPRPVRAGDVVGDLVGDEVDHLRPGAEGGSVDGDRAVVPGGLGFAGVAGW